VYGLPASGTKSADAVEAAASVQSAASAAVRAFTDRLSRMAQASRNREP
jgi:hypothetical protein